jgi:hypothetical protein
MRGKAHEVKRQVGVAAGPSAVDEAGFGSKLGFGDEGFASEASEAKRCFVV